MSQRIPCAEYDEKASRCKSGFPKIHSDCWGGTSGCPTCGNTDSKPMCMQEDMPSHLIRSDGLPLGWPV
jgi:hypothetical protein